MVPAGSVPKKMQKSGEASKCASSHSSSEMSVKHSAEYEPYSSLDNHYLTFHREKKATFLSPTVTDELMFKLNLPFILKKTA